MKILLTPEPDQGGIAKEKPAETIARLTAELAEAKARINTLEAEKTARNADEVLISAKIALGLTRDQALAVIKRQKEHDAAEKAKATKSDKTKA